MDSLIESVVLTGGASRRMGADKASLLVEGVPLAELVVGRLLEAGYPVTVLGPASVLGCPFVPDSLDTRRVEGFSQESSSHPTPCPLPAKQGGGSLGPLLALSRFTPQADRVFVASCDLVAFDSRLVAYLAGYQESEAVVPVIKGREQPLAALYKADAFAVLPKLVAEGNQRMFAWLGQLNLALVSEVDMKSHGIDPRWATGANTPEALRELL